MNRPQYGAIVKPDNTVIPLEFHEVEGEENTFQAYYVTDGKLAYMNVNDTMKIDVLGIGQSVRIGMSYKYENC